MSDNCILDWENKILIPQNANTFLLIHKNNEWKYSIDISLRLNEPINFDNLLITLLSYAWNSTFMVKVVSIVIIRSFDEKNAFVTENIDMRLLKSLNSFSFEEWFHNKLIRDSKYINKNEDLYCFRIQFMTEVIKGLDNKFNTNCLLYLKPLFPWKDEVIDFLKITNIEKLELLKENLQLKKKIKELEERLKKI